MAGLYIHVPFCHSKCAYCDFYSMPAARLADRYVDAAIHEFDCRREEIRESFTTVYLGGGTPSILTPSQLDRLISALPVSDAKEFTIEANPEDVTKEAVDFWISRGINRVSMGVQSFDDDELKAIKRRHNSSDAIKAIEILLSCNLSSISCDLIYGLPGQTLISWDKSLSKMLSFGLPHLSAYCLSYEPGTALTARVTAGHLKPTDDDTLREMYDKLCDMTARHNYEHYEISSFAQSGQRAIHNSSYWKSIPYLGLGPGAHSFDGKLRRINPPRLNDYISGNYKTIIENEDEDERFNDILITALRTSDGLSLNDIEHGRSSRLLHDAKRFIDIGLMIIENNHLRFTESAWFTSDSILADLIQVF